MRACSGDTPGPGGRQASLVLAGMLSGPGTPLRAGLGRTHKGLLADYGLTPPLLSPRLAYIVSLRPRKGLGPAAQSFDIPRELTQERQNCEKSPGYAEK